MQSHYYDPNLVESIIRAAGSTLEHPEKCAIAGRSGCGDLLAHGLNLTERMPGQTGRKGRIVAVTIEWES